ncbi:MAG TPA: GAF domain-containing protein, partial [Rhodanobacter sp.]|nr:GAF domain-containing protein [Rhodanobacter sp.]
MSIRHWVALLLGILTAAVCLYLPFVQQTILPIGAKPLDRQHYVIEASSYAVPLPAGLLAGDVVDAARMDVTSRLGLMTYALVPAGTRITLAVNRQGRELQVQVPVAFVPTPFTVLNLIDVVSGIALIWLVAALGLLILWRGSRLAAVGVGIWCLVKLCWEIPISTPLPLPLAGWIDVIGMALFYSGSLVGAYLLAEDLAWEQVQSGARRWIRACFVLVVIVYLMMFVGNDLAFHLGGRWWYDPAHLNFRLLAHLLAFGIPIGMLLSRYRRAQAINRARIRWVLASVACVVAAYLVNSDWASTVLSSIQVDILYDVFNAAAFIGFTYAVLRHRLVAVQVVLNRALVSALAIAIVLAVFGSLESLIEHEALGHRASTFIALAVPLVLGIFFDQINKRITRWVKYLFFRKQFLAEAALSRFSRECGYITSAEILVDRALAEISRHVGAPAASMYENAGDGYRCLQQRGNRDFPDRLGMDDPACVRLRASLTETTLDDLDSTLGADGLAFPVALRGVLIGVLVLARRPGELYTPQERELLLHVTHQVGTSLHAMYVSRTRGFVTDVANGMLPSSEQTRVIA